MNCLPLEPLNIIIRGQMSYQHATEVNTRDKPVYGQEIVFHKYNTNGWGEKKFLLKDFLLKMKADDHVHNVKRKLSIVKWSRFFPPTRALSVSAFVILVPFPFRYTVCHKCTLAFFLMAMCLYQVLSF